MLAHAHASAAVERTLTALFTQQTCLNRIAALSPAGPDPTMQTS